MRRTVRTVCTLAIPSHAASTSGLSGRTFPRRQPPSAQITAQQSPSSIRSLRAWALNPPNTTEWIAPTRAQARTAMASSGIIGM